MGYQRKQYDKKKKIPLKERRQPRPSGDDDWKKLRNHFERIYNHEFEEDTDYSFVDGAVDIPGDYGTGR